MTESTYGRACLQCFKSKSKCVVRSGSESCERCHRLKKQCSPADSIRKRNTPRGSAARTAKLEEKLDGIVSLLQSVTGSTTLPLPLPNGPTPVAIVGDSPTLYQQSMNSFSTPVSSSADDCEPQHSKVGSWGSTNPNKTSLHSSHTQPLSADEPHPNKAENDLAIFRSDMLPTFAFMNLSPSVSARELGQTRPILLQSIMVVTSTTVQRKNHLSTEFLKTLTHDVFVLHRGHLDHLLGILIFLAWGNDNSNKNHLIQLGMSLALDLRLNKPLIDEGAHKFARMVGCDSRVLSGVHTLEERRAVLGCFFMSSLISSFMGRIDPLHWTSQMDEHLRVIEESKECIADEGFAIQIRLQLLQYRSSQMRDFEGENSQRSKISSTFQLKALQAQLHDIKASISHRLQQDISIMSSYHYTEVSICERAFPAHTPISCSTTGLQHLQCMCDCLSATKSFIDLLFSMPQAGYLGMPLHYRMQCMRCLAALYRLSVHEDPGWDKQAVRNTIDLMAVFDRIIINLEQRSAGIENPDEDVMIQVCKVMKGFRAFCSTKLVQEETLMGENSGQAMSDPDIPPYFMDLTDDSWLQDVLGWSVY
ncbi:hypothetical protein BKA65DRAFT_76605 [Rhexocercosporidium sp. MPI-PUGE-AT-0058]|nr:hypothetical protein BKA65DRAFT_76605 [Rhexocercosporidium sp. MPI-PUGE-AT-0058]